MFARPPSKTGIRAGAIMAMLLASLLVASMLGLALIKTVLVHHRQMQVMSRQQQCFWLAEAGAQRAVQKLADSSDYGGEKWEVSADAIPHAPPAVVTIEIGKVAGAALAREIKVEARFGSHPAWTNACRRELLVYLPTQSPASPGKSKNESKNSVMGRSPDRPAALVGGSGDRPQLSKNKPKNVDPAPKVPNDSQP